MRVSNLTVDCANPTAVARFWAATLGYAVPAADASGDNATAYIEPSTGQSGPALYFQRVPEGKVAKNRIHLDLAVAAAEFDRELQRLIGLGAQASRLFNEGGSTWQTMTDVEGNEFCVVKGGE